MSEPIALRHLVGDNIRSLRKANKLSQEELGERAGLSYKFVGEIERGTVNPSLDSLECIAGALDVDVARLLLREGRAILSDSEAADAMAALETLNRVIANYC